MNVRIIPRLDIKGPNLVKGIRFEGLRVLGRPEQAAQYYYAHGADEFILMDTVASLYGRNSLNDIIKKTAEKIFIPLTVGGGLRSVDDIRAVLLAGADKVSLNTAAMARPELIREASEQFGASTIVISIEPLKHDDGTYEAMTDFGRESSGLDAVEWALQAEKLGAGEIMVTSIEQEGTGKGFDLELISRISRSVSIPVIAAGGGGNAQHVVDSVMAGGADAVCLASLLHYNYIKQERLNEVDGGEEGNTEFLSSRNGFSLVEDVTLGGIKKFLVQNGVQSRLEPGESA